ncbi:MAG: exo-alpha-sialidase [Planctomycetes bacterium]|nr:exo-alpha-sialidase [Planctomycetota bacterium]
MLPTSPLVPILLAAAAAQAQPPQDAQEIAPLAPGYTLPLIDLDADATRQTVVDREPGQYLGHPTTVLLEDGRTILAVYPKGHGKGPIVMKRSADGGLTWSDRLPTPESWATSQEVPTIYRVVDAAGKRRLILFSGLYPIRIAVSEDDGLTWGELEPIGDYGGIVANAALTEVGPGEYLSWFHDDGRFIGERHAPPDDGSRFHLYQIRSDDGGLSWSAPEVIASHPVAHLCEPGVVWSPDGGTMALLLRENSRTLNSHVIFSRDRGRSWSEPRELPAALTGDRHTAVRAADGRLFISFRDTARESATQGDWCAWVGTWQDIVEGREGQYRVRLKDNRHRWDCAYPGVVILPDDTIVTTTYGHWEPGEQPYILSIRLRLEELDSLAG